MNKRQLIEQIQVLNTTATEQFLSQFDESDLQQYLQHLQDAQKREKRIATFARKPSKLRMVS
jgi:DNA-binding TFAR19-related protein (PDSD5 family)